MPTPRAAAAAPTPQRPAANDFRVADRDIYMVGIGGCGMSGLARMLRGRGARVSGSDAVPSPVTDRLLRDGYPVGFQQRDGALPEACDLVIASAAIGADHPELMLAQQRGCEVLTYAEAVGRCMIGRTGVSVAGTHGKSTTSAMLGTCLVDAGLDPSVIVGATCPQLAAGALASCASEARPAGHRVGADAIPVGPLAGSAGIVLAEACEFNRSFHHHRPTIGVITSVEADHLDIYGSLDAVVEAFADFARLLPGASDGGRLLIAHEGAHRREVTAGLRCGVETIGFSPGADWCVSADPATCRVSLTGPPARSTGEPVAISWVSALPGEHNAMNAGVAAAVAIGLGADPAIVAQSLEAFSGLDRRTQFLGERTLIPGMPPVRVYDDYGHHPTEIDLTLRSLRLHERPQERLGRVVCVFQPHQHSRTRFLLDEFATSFEEADVVIVPHIYFVRDSEIEKAKVTASDLVDRLRSRGVRAMHLYPFEAIVEQLENVCQPGDLLVVMGAGPVWHVAHDFLRLTR